MVNPGCSTPSLTSNPPSGLPAPHSSGPPWYLAIVSAALYVSEDYNRQGDTAEADRVNALLYAQGEDVEVLMTHCIADFGSFTFETLRQVACKLAVQRHMTLTQIAMLGLPEIVRMLNGNTTAKTPPSEGNGGKETGKTPSKRGRPIDTDHKEDKRVYEAWITETYVKYEDLARELGMTRRKIKNIVDRHRKRLRKPDNSSE